MKYYSSLLTVLITVLGLIPITTSAQQKTTYLLPDGSVLPANKLDSLTKAWGGSAHMAFTHSAEDDKNNILRLVKITEEEVQKAATEHALQQEALQAMVNKPAPLWKATDITGKTWSLEELRGKVVVMNFWFTSCGPCILEMPHLNKLVDQFSGKEVVFIAFTWNDAAPVKSFLNKKPFDFIQAPGASTVIEAYGIQSYPTSFVIDQSGMIRLAINYDGAIGEKLAHVINDIL